ncbi:molybdenum cofactor biosynthesis protein [Rhodotorula toruloides]|uniref:molybdopterin adenylyltransferase n=1 Tax=Rhodotorula toruloides TaxID=5286 RepID=A0A511KER0_RHOTO|nr:molybdenum cofactor biosynthesis protein [Rhodotorula toruloides]
MAYDAVPTVPRLAALVLLGGKSSRMGRPKALLPHPKTGMPLYKHHLRVLEELEQEGVFPEGVWISGRGDQRDELELPEAIHYVVDDPAKNGDIGPASGILQAFDQNPDATWLLLAVDLPFVTRSAIVHLLQSHPTDSPVSLFLHPSDGNPEPLFSVWTPRALAQLRENCKKGKSGPCRAAKDVWGGKIVEGCGGVKVLEENWITDADTPEEWERAIASLSAVKAAPLAEPSIPPTPPASPPPPQASTSLPVFAPIRRQPISFTAAIDAISRLEPRKANIASSSKHVEHQPTSVTSVPVEQAVGCLASSFIYARFPHPLHDNSAMDGYAIPSSLLSSASPSSPVELPVLGRIVAGDSPPLLEEVEAAGKVGCWEIMTGAVFPSDEFDAVVKVEDAWRATASDAAGRPVVVFKAPVVAGQNRRRRGEQVQAGEIVLREGELVSPEKVLLLVATGISSVSVRSVRFNQLPRRGRVGIIATGKEVIPLSALSSAEPSPGQVVDCVTPYLCAVLRSRGYEATVFSPSGDSTSSFASTVSTALSSSSPLDLLLTTAGVSLGVTDHLPTTLSSLGLREIFHGVSIRPGGPVMLTLHANETAGRTTPVLSLPGNPMASAACMRSFGCAILMQLEGEADGEWKKLEVKTEEEERAWADLTGKMRKGLSSFFALPVDEKTGEPSLACRMIGERRAGPCAVGSLVGAEAWVRVDAGPDGSRQKYWCKF